MLKLHQVTAWSIVVTNTVLSTLAYYVMFALFFNYLEFLKWNIKLFLMIILSLFFFLFAVQGAESQGLSSSVDLSYHPICSDLNCNSNGVSL